MTVESTVYKILEEGQVKHKDTYEEVDDSGRGERGVRCCDRSVFRSVFSDYPYELS